MLYSYLKAFHLIFMVTWFAGLFYIFRLFVYHVKFRENAEMAKAYSLMEKKLLYIIMHPSMLLTIGFGVGMLISHPEIFQQKWIHIKLALVAILMGYQIFSGIVHKRFSKNNYFLSEKACRFINEVPSFLLIAIVFLAIFKPV